MMEAGNYYVGDLCYVLHEEWDEVCALLIDGANGGVVFQGEFTLKDGRTFAVYNTAWGDGVYYDQKGRSYDVDAGCIGCIRYSDIDVLDDRNHISGGQIIGFDEAFATGNDNGVISFGTVAINTAAAYEEEDEYEYDCDEE